MEIAYTFRNKALLNMALTHVSFANEREIESNQRLEFLGDSILSFVVAEYLYHKYPDFDEGRLTEIRAAAVCEKSLAAASRKMHIGDAIKFGKSEKVCGGKEKDSILADTFETILGAIYLDSDIDTARAWIMKQLIQQIEHATTLDLRNYKSEIQSYFQKRDKGTEVVCYRLKERTGPDHCPVFSVEAVYKDKVIGTGTGSSMKRAEQAAAKEALLKIEKR